MQTTEPANGIPAKVFRTTPPTAALPPRPVQLESLSESNTEHPVSILSQQHNMAGLSGTRQQKIQNDRRFEAHEKLHSQALSTQNKLDRQPNPTSKSAVELAYHHDGLASSKHTTMNMRDASRDFHGSDMMAPNSPLSGFQSERLAQPHPSQSSLSVSDLSTPYESQRPCIGVSRQGASHIMPPFSSNQRPVPSFMLSTYHDHPNHSTLHATAMNDPNQYGDAGYLQRSAIPNSIRRPSVGSHMQSEYSTMMVNRPRHNAKAPLKILSNDDDNNPSHKTGITHMNSDATLASTASLIIGALAFVYTPRPLTIKAIGASQSIPGSVTYLNLNNDTTPAMAMKAGDLNFVTKLGLGLTIQVESSNIFNLVFESVELSGSLISLVDGSTLPTSSLFNMTGSVAGASVPQGSSTFNMPIFFYWSINAPLNSSEPFTSALAKYCSLPPPSSTSSLLSGADTIDGPQNSDSIVASKSNTLQVNYTLVMHKKILFWNYAPGISSQILQIPCPSQFGDFLMTVQSVTSRNNSTATNPPRTTSTTVNPPPAMPTTVNLPPTIPIIVNPPPAPSTTVNLPPVIVTFTSRPTSVAMVTSLATIMDS
ncbi:hypothetical protein BDEG_27570 [Batrachochytrium dendrobatidis JEL423]|uniref:Uncharacterized protein n=1 Tax=Batrachochytrium dendrobatidis (strain JEL423) TaxID=403673 RepID=A0A177WWK2_BATDL|nr:hypothetical protein BDEG_27570 [Batrachochytrium dendrobatidis JEL423]